MDNAPNDETPWSIPIREAGPEIPQRAATWVDRMPLTPIAAGAVALFVSLVFALVVLDGAPVESGPEVLGGGVEGTRTEAEPDPPSTATTTVPSTSASTTIPPTTTPSTSSTEAPPSTSPTTAAATVPVDPEPAGLPIHTPGDLGGGWVAQVSSVPVSAGGSALARSFETVRSLVPDALIVRGSDWASLRDGYWVVLHPGYDDASSAVEDCDRWGLDGRDACFARVLSPDDGTQRICWRDESGALAGDCT